MFDKFMCMQNFDAKLEMPKSRWNSKAIAKVQKKKKHFPDCIGENCGISKHITVTDCSHWCEISPERVRKENPQRDGESTSETTEL